MAAPFSGNQVRPSDRPQPKSKYNSPGSYASTYSSRFWGQGEDQLGVGGAAQQNALGMYGKMASGQGPSVAEQQMRRGADQSIAAAAAMQARGRGGNLAGMQQAAGAQGAGMLADTNQQAAMLRAQEQQAAMAGIAGLGTQMYGQGLDSQNMALQGNIAQGQQNIDWGLGMRELDLQKRQQDYERRMGWARLGIGATLGAGETIAKFVSDERAKTNIRELPMTASETIGAIPSKSFEYRPEYGAPGQRIGIMAQDLERTPAGAALVVDTPAGKMVDSGGLTALNTAAISEQQRELDAMKAQLGTGGMFASDERMKMNIGGSGGSRRREIGALYEQRMGEGRDISGLKTSRSKGEPDPGQPGSSLGLSMVQGGDPFSSYDPYERGERMLSDERSKQDIRPVAYRGGALAVDPQTGEPEAQSFQQPYLGGELPASEHPHTADLTAGHRVQRPDGQSAVLPQAPNLSPEEQQLVDAAWDIVDRTTYVDETGKRRAREQVVPEDSQFFYPRSERRFMNELAEDERQDRIQQLVPDDRPRQTPARVRVSGPGARNRLGVL